MGSHLIVEMKETESVAYLELSGSIDEDNELDELGKRINKPAVVVNAGNIDRINSCGVRDWVNWLNELGKRGTELYLVECSPAIMTQVNLVCNFVGAGSVLSFYAPYFCPDCKEEKMLLFETEEMGPSIPTQAPPCRCDQCDQAMEFDDIESSYFAFLGAIKRKPADPSVADAIKQFSGRQQGTLRARRNTSNLHRLTPSSGESPSPSSFPFHTPPTIPRGLELPGMLDTGAAQQKQPRKGGFSTDMVLYLTVGLLVLAIGLLAYVALTRGG